MSTLFSFTSNDLIFLEFFASKGLDAPRAFLND